MLVWNVRGINCIAAFTSENKSSGCPTTACGVNLKCPCRPHGSNCVKHPSPDVIAGRDVAKKQLAISPMDPQLKVSSIGGARNRRLTAARIGISFRSTTRAVDELMETRARRPGGTLAQSNAHSRPTAQKRPPCVSRTPSCRRQSLNIHPGGCSRPWPSSKMALRSPISTDVPLKSNPISAASHSCRSLGDRFERKRYTGAA